MTRTAFETDGNGTLFSPWKTPVNIAAEAEGSIHNDGTAQQLGLEGGWIAGSIHMEQFAPLLIERFGEAWLSAGTMSVYFRNATLSGQSVRARLMPFDRITGSARLEMEDEAGRIVCEGSACLGAPKSQTLLGERLAARQDTGPGPLLAGVKIGSRVAGIPSRIPEERLRQDLPGITAPIEAYTSGALPTNLAVDVLRAVETHLVCLPEGSVGLYGGIELQLTDGPLKAGVTYHCNGEIVAVGQTPKTETLWYSAEVFEQQKLKARMLMLSRIMRLG
jgi:hypothetical protein